MNILIGVGIVAFALVACGRGGQTGDGASVSPPDEQAAETAIKISISAGPVDHLADIPVTPTALRSPGVGQGVYGRLLGIDECLSRPEPCMVPYELLAGQIIEVRSLASSGLVASERTDEAGWFEIRLAEGDYRVDVQTAGEIALFITACTSQDATVASGFTNVPVSCALDYSK